MIKLLVVFGFFFLASCTVNVYDYSTHSHSSSYSASDDGSVIAPDAIAEPDTIVTRRNLLGGGYVRIETSGPWTKYVLHGCKTETDGVFVEMRPVMEVVSFAKRTEIRTFTLEFTCKMQSFLLEQNDESTLLSGHSSISRGSTVLPVVTGTELITIVSDGTSYPFLFEEAKSYDGDWLPDGTLAYDAIFSLPDWMLREICTPERELLVLSKTPEYRMLFGDNERRLLQQFFDIFVIHNGEAPALPVGVIRK